MTSDKSQQITRFTIRPTTTQLRTREWSAAKRRRPMPLFPKSEEMRRKGLKLLLKAHKVGRTGNVLLLQGVWLRLFQLAMKWGRSAHSPRNLDFAEDRLALWCATAPPIRSSVKLHHNHQGSSGVLQKTEGQARPAPTKC